MLGAWVAVRCGVRGRFNSALLEVLWLLGVAGWEVGIGRNRRNQA